MNRKELISKIMQDRAELSHRHESMQKEAQDEHSSEETLGHIADMLDGMADLLTKNVQKVRILNHQGTQKVAGTLSIEEADELLHKLDQVEDTLERNLQKLSGTLVGALRETKEVTVANQVEIPKMPPYPTSMQTSVTSMPKYVSEGLEKIYKVMRDKDYQVNVQTEAPVVNVSLEAVTMSLEALKASLDALLAKEPVTVERPDFSGLESVLDSIKVQLDAVRQNTGVQVSQTFNSSWEKSKHMQSLDAAASTAYTTVASRKVTDYIQFTDNKGVVWRKTYSYDGDGDVTSWTDWTQQ